MDSRINDFYDLSDLDQYENVHLLDLRETCLHPETQLRDMAAQLPERQRYILEAYLDIRDKLEFQTVRTALQWGKQHNK